MATTRRLTVTGRLTSLTVMAACLTARYAPALEVPLGGAEGIDDLRLVAPADVEAHTRSVDGAGGEARRIEVIFAKEPGPRRFLALEAKAADVPPSALAIVLECRVKLTAGEPPRLAALLWERGGGAWFKVNAKPVALGEFAPGRISLRSLREAGFSRDASGELELGNVEKVWVGLVLGASEEKASGSLELGGARFTDEPFKPARALRITGDGPGRWTVGKDPAVRAELTTPGEGPGGGPCMKVEFTFPGGRHMYMVPTTPVPDAELEGYAGLRFTYRASPPPGIGELLVMLIERNGAQYLAGPAPPASAEWTTVTIPFKRFSLGGWSKDPNGRLDLGELASVAVACHGTASGTGGQGTILVTDIEFVP